MGKKYGLSGAFVLLCALLLCCESISLLAALLLAVAIHEGGHIGAIWLCGGQVERLVLGLGGMDIRYRCSRDTYGKDAFIALMGPGMNLLSCGVGAFLANRLPWEGIYLFCGCSAILGFFNLLPALPLDGGVFLRAMLLRRGELEWSDRVLTASSLAVGVLLLCAGTVLFVSSGGNCTLLVCAGAVLGRLVRNYFTQGRKSFIV